MMDESVVDGKDFKAPEAALLNGFRFQYRTRKNSGVRKTLQRACPGVCSEVRHPVSCSEVSNPVSCSEVSHPVQENSSGATGNCLAPSDVKQSHPVQEDSSGATGNCLTPSDAKRSYPVQEDSSGATGNCLAPSDAKRSHPVQEDLSGATGNCLAPSYGKQPEGRDSEGVEAAIESSMPASHDFPGASVQKELFEEASTPVGTVTPDVNEQQKPASSASEAVSNEVPKSFPFRPRVSAVRSFPNGCGKDSTNDSSKLDGCGIKSTSTNAAKDSLDVVLALPTSCADVSRAKVDEPKSQVKDCSKKRKREEEALCQNEAIAKDKNDSLKPIIVSLSAGRSRTMSSEFHANSSESFDKKRKRQEETQCGYEGIERDRKDSSMQKLVIENSRHTEDVQAARQKVLDTLFLFETIYSKLIQDESKPNLQTDLLAWKLFNQQNSMPNNTRNYIGSVPGVDVGDEFNLRVELCIIGLHRPHRRYVDFTYQNGEMVATSIVHNRTYAEGTNNNDENFVFSTSGDWKPEENQALKNSLNSRTPVRIIHGFKGYRSNNNRGTTAKSKVATYIYSGLYLVEEFHMKKCDDGLYASIFQFKRISGQPKLVMKGANASKGSMKADDAIKGSGSLQDLTCDSICVVNQVGRIGTRHSNLESSPAYSVDAENVNVDALESHVKCSAMKIKLKDEAPHLNQAIERDDKSSSLQKPVTGGRHQSEHAVPARQKVMEALSLFETIYTKLLEDEELKRKLNPKEPKQPLQADMVAFKLFNQQYMNPSSGMKHIGSAPGVEVGDEFNLRVELCIAGLHLHHRHCVDFTDQRGKMVAISIVHMTPYTDGTTIINDFVYSSSGDLKLDANLALKNSLDTRTPIRVIHGFNGYRPSNFRATRAKKRIITYIYGGLYLVKKYWRKKGDDGLYACKFQLRRIPEQPKLFMKGTKGSIDLKARPGQIIKDISEGKERLPISVVNTIDDEHPKPFKYITKMMYSSQHSRSPPTGCDCVGRCSDSDSCACSVKNGGEIPFNFSGAIVEAKPLVYECTPSCKCPPSCHNRVSQHGIKFHLEVFKTESRGWGVRSLDPIPSGSFVCEYTGELIDDQIADKRANDEYLFDIGNNYYDETLWKGLNTKVPDLQIGASTEVEEGSFAVDASEQGNVARFINHSCTPNLYAQNLLHDHDNKTMPHAVLFATEDIPPLQELTYDYNYAIDQVRDSNGNIKKKVCYCGTSDCTGWLY